MRLMITEKNNSAIFFAELFFSVMIGLIAARE